VSPLILQRSTADSTPCQTFEHLKIIASHDLDLIMDVCHRCIVIKEGTVVADGPVSEILTNKKLLEENHLELPLSLQRR
jgi:cobalt/nickel transport system ATP-binding protein